MSGRHQPEAGADSAAALRSFTPPPEYRAFRVEFDDFDGGRGAVIVNAIGPNIVEELARAKARELGYDVMAVLSVREVK